MKENMYQAMLIKRLVETFPGCVVTKMTAPPQGTPDLQILLGKTWAKLEVKVSLKEPFQPNQEYYIELFNIMSFAAMICPENENDVLEALAFHFLKYS